MSTVMEFRESARQWFDDELSATDAKYFLAHLYAAMLLADAMEVPEYYDLARMWNSLAIAGHQLDADAQNRRVFPTHRPDCRVLPNWLRPVMGGLKWNAASAIISRLLTSAFGTAIARLSRTLWLSIEPTFQRSDCNDADAREKMAMQERLERLKFGLDECKHDETMGLERTKIGDTPERRDAFQNVTTALVEAIRGKRKPPDGAA